MECIIIYFLQVSLIYPSASFECSSSHILFLSVFCSYERFVNHLIHDILWLPDGLADSWQDWSAGVVCVISTAESLTLTATLASCRAELSYLVVYGASVEAATRTHK